MNLGSNKQIKTIIDIGANIGLSSLYLGDSFPDSIIYAIEPEYENYQMLLRNIILNRATNIVPVNAVVWHQNEDLEISSHFRDKLSWSFQTVASDKNNKKCVKGITLESLMKENNVSKIDIMKMDIEGAEKQIFLNYPLINELLSITDFIAMEIHDEVINRELIYNSLISNNFSLFESGETVYAYR